MDAADRAIPSGVLRFLAVAALGVVVLVGGLLWDVVGHDRNPDLAHQEGVLTLANPAHVVFLVGLVAVVVGVAGASLSVFAPAGAGPGQHRLKWVGVVAVVTLVAVSAGLFAVASGAGAGAGDGAGAAHEAAARQVQAGAPPPALPAAHHDQKPAPHPQHAEAGCAPSAAQKAAADRLFADTKASVARFGALAAATNEGYRPVTPPSWSTVHYVNPAYLADGSILDPARPEALIYANPGRGPVLAAGMYVMNRPGEAGPEVGGCLTKWHTHTDLCFSSETLQVVGFVSADGTCSAGSIPYVPPDMMHVWVVDVPGGPFAHQVDGAALAQSLGR